MNDEIKPNLELNNLEYLDSSIETKKKDNNKKSLNINTFFYLIYTSLNIIFPFITGIYVARVLLPVDIGQIEIVRNLVQYFVILAFLGIPTYGLREISKYRNNRDELSKIYTELRIINNISTLIFYVLYLFVVFLVPSYRSHYPLFLIVGILIILNLFNNSFLYEGLEEFKYISIRNLVFKVLSFILLILFVRSESDIYAYAIILTVGTAGNYFLNIIHARKYVKITFKNLNLRRHMKSIITLVLVNIAIEIYTLVDVTMLGLICDEETVAFYSYGMKIYKILLQVINSFTIVVVPRIALYYKEKNQNEVNRIVSKTFIIIIMLSIPMIIGIWYTSNYLVCMIYGYSYIRSANVLKILCFISLISPIGYLLGSRMLLISGNESRMIIPVCCGAIINILLNLVLINFYSEIGAAIASLVSEIIVMTIYLLLGRGYYKLENVIKSLVKIVVASMIILLYCWLMSCFFTELTKTVLQIIGSVLLYFLTLIVLKEPNLCELIKKVLRRVFKCAKS